MKRLMITVAALAIPLSATTVGLVGMSGTAGAAAPTSCTKVSGSVATGVTVKGCGGGLGKGTAAATSATTGTITWKGHGKGTTGFTVASITQAATNRCGTSATEFDVVGTVSSDTTGAVTVGAAASAEVCVNNTSGAVSLVKHTLFSF